MPDMIRCPSCGREAKSLNIRSGRQCQDDPPQSAELWALPCGCDLTGDQALALRFAIYAAAAGEETPEHG